MITSAQIRGARAFLGISQVELSYKTEVSMPTITRLEASDDAVERASGKTIKKIKSYFEEKGIKFIPERKKDGLREGIRFIDESFQEE